MAGVFSYQLVPPAWPPMLGRVLCETASVSRFPGDEFHTEVQDQTKWLVFSMIHVKDSLLPMGKVWSLDFLGYSSIDKGNIRMYVQF